MEKEAEQVDSSIGSTADTEWRGLLQLFRTIVTQPTDFFEHMQLEGGLKEPLLFMALCSGLASAGQIIATFKPMLGIQEFIGRVIFSFISAGFLMALSRGFGGKGNFEHTYRAYVYGTAPAVVSWIPLLNYVAFLYTLFLLYLSLQRAQEGLEAKRVIWVLALYIGVMIGFSLMLVFAVLGGTLHKMASPTGI